jgi:hypothetical protein
MFHISGLTAKRIAVTALIDGTNENRSVTVRACTVTEESSLFSLKYLKLKI